MKLESYGGEGAYLGWFCPGCKCGHAVPTTGPHKWKWNGSMEAPTFTPSVLHNKDGKSSLPLCHVFIANGKIEFLPDCTHELAGQTVDMEEVEP